MLHTYYNYNGNFQGQPSGQNKLIVYLLFIINLLILTYYPLIPTFIL